MKALIFDLDNCLAPAKAVGVELFQPALDAISAANHGLVSKPQLRKAFDDCWRHPLDWVAAQYGFSDEMLSAGWRVFETMEVTRPMQGYEDLPVLATLPAQRFLVTSGFRRLQSSKVRALNIEPHFTEALIDAIDEPHRLGKRGLFEKILCDHHLSRAEVLVVGDNGDSEIKAGNELGIATVQTLRAGVPVAVNATFHIKTLSELLPLIANKS